MSEGKTARLAPDVWQMLLTIQLARKTAGEERVSASEIIADGLALLAGQPVQP